MKGCDFVKLPNGFGTCYKLSGNRRRQWDKTMKALAMRHTPHEARHTAASLLDSAGINDTLVKMILGHARKGVTKAVYTHKTLSELRKAVDIL